MKSVVWWNLVFQLDLVKSKRGYNQVEEVGETVKK